MEGNLYRSDWLVEGHRVRMPVAMDTAARLLWMWQLFICAPVVRTLRALITFTNQTNWLAIALPVITPAYRSGVSLEGINYGWRDQ